MKHVSALSFWFVVLAIWRVSTTTAQSCAGAGEEAKSCGGRGPIPKKCCGDLVCSSGLCQEGGGGGGGGGGGTGETCPTTLKTSCIAFAKAGGRCQSLHFIVRVVDEHDNPVVGAEVTATPESPDSGIEPPFTGTTSASTFKGYKTAVKEQCGDGSDDELVYVGGTPARCWQQTEIGTYKATVTRITWDRCPDASFDPTDNFKEYYYNGQCD